MATKQTKEFDEFAKQLLKGIKTHTLAVRELLELFGQAKRGREVTRFIKYKLWYYGLETTPDFGQSHIDAKVTLHMRADGKGGAGRRYVSDSVTAGSKTLTPVQIENEIEALEGVSPLITLGMVLPPDRQMHAVRTNDPYSKVVTLLMMENLSHVPVLQSPRKAEGMVTWKAVGTALHSGRIIKTVADCMEPNPRVVRLDTPLLKAIEEVLKYGAILVEGDDKSIKGIFTSDDVAKQFIASAQPFLILEEIENRLRKLIRKLKLTESELKGFVDPTDVKRLERVCKVEDLTFGEYARIIQSEVVWTRFSIPLERNLFCGRLDQIRDIRNSVMHFDPDGITLEERQTLMGFRDLLQLL
jgi:predicted transcriptional regulator